MYAFENKIEELLKKERIAGCAVALSDRKGVIYSHGFGVESIERPEVAVSGGSLFRAASITKMVTGVLIMRLVERGELSLDMPIREYIPWFTLSDKAAAELVTAKLLLSHRAGFPAEYTPVGPREESALEEVLKREVPQLELAYFPDEGYTYSNWGFRLLSLIAEKITGRRYSELAREYVLSPLMMNRSTFDLNVAATYPLSLPHERGEGGEPKVMHFIKENYARLGTGGLYSSAEELTALGRLILNGGVADSGERVISESSLALMMSPNTTHASGNSYGLAMQIHPTEFGAVLYGHYGNADPFTSALMADTKSGHTVAVMLNTYSKDLRAEISDLVLSEM